MCPDPWYNQGGHAIGILLVNKVTSHFIYNTFIVLHLYYAILSYMASNGLVANAKKSVFMILNIAKKDCKNELAKEISIGGTIVERSTATKLHGVTIDDTYKNGKNNFQSPKQLNLCNKKNFKSTPQNRSTQSCTLPLDV